MPIVRPDGPLRLLLSQLKATWDSIDALSGGDVVGPPSAVNDRIAVFDGTTGKLLKDGGATIAEIVAGSGGLVTSVFGRTGAIVAATDDYTWAQINKATSSLADIATRSASDLNSGTLPAGRMPALTGDVTTSAGSVATTIANNAVTLAKLADIATASFLGRNTAGTGDTEVLSIATAKTMLNLAGTNSGDVTLAGENYLSISAQVITALAVNLSGTHVTGTLPVNKGGTGATTFTANGVLYGNTTGAIQVTAQGAANTVLIANAGAPSFSASPVIGTSITVPLITTLSSGNLTIAPTGSVTFDPTGNQIDPLTNYDLNLGQLSKKYLTLHAAELWVETLVAQDTIATIGGRILVGPTTVLTSDLAAAATSIVVKHNQMINGDRVYLESSGKVEFLAITSGPSGTGPYTYTVTRNLDGTGANDWFAGDAVFNTGQTGNGFIDLYSVRGVKTSSQTGPTIVGNVRNSATYNDWSERWAIGNLNGLYGYGTNIYGVAMGVPTAAWVKIDPTNGVRIGHNTTTLTQIDASGNASFTGSITSSSGTIAGWTISSSSITKNEVKIAAGVNAAFVAGTGEAWFGKSASGYYGMVLKGTTADHMQIVAGNSAVGSTGRPYIVVHDGARVRLAIGELNTTSWDGSATNSLGMKVWSQAGALLVHFSDVQNTISGWTVSADSISKSEVKIAAGANASLVAGTGEAWFGKSAVGYYGLILKGTTAATFQIVAGNSSIGTAGRPYLSIYDGTRIRIVLGELNTTEWDGAATNSLGMKIWSSTGALLVHFSDVANVIAGWTIAATKISSTGIDIHSGANAALAFGTTPPTSASAGTGIWLDRDGLTGLLSGVVQAQVNASGKFTAGAGVVVADVDGIAISQGDAKKNKLKWISGFATDMFTIHGRAIDTATIEGVITTTLVGMASGGDATLSFAAVNDASASAVITVRSNGSTRSSKAGQRFVSIGANNGVLIHTGNTHVDAGTSAALDISSTTGALIVPRMTTTQRDALTAANGMIVYNTSTDKFQGRAAGAWVDLH